MSRENEQVRRNLFFNVLSLMINVSIGIFYTPYLVKTLGILAYGVLPLALVINQYISVITGSLTSALTRFYTIALQKENMYEASKYISTSLLVVLGIIVVLILPGYFFVSNIEGVFTIPINLVFSAKKLFAFSLLSFAASLVSSVLNISLYAYNRLDYLNLISIIRLSLRFFLILLLFSFVDVDIAYVGIASFATEILILLFSFFAFWKITGGSIRLSLRLFDKSSLGVLSVMASWVIVQQFGDTMLYRTDNVIINKFWSTQESGIVGAFTELGTYTITVATVITSLFGPLILQAYGRDDQAKVRQMTLDNSVCVGIIVAVFIGILCGFSPIILKVWLGDNFVAYNSWLYFKLMLIPFYAAAGVFSFAARAWNKVKLLAIGTLVLGFVNLVVVWIVANYFNTGKHTVSIILFICMLFGIVQSYLLNAVVFAKIYKHTCGITALNGLKILIVLVAVFFIGYFLNPMLLRYSYFISLSLVFVIALISLGLSLKFALTKEQVATVLSLIRKK